MTEFWFCGARSSPERYTAPRKRGGDCSNYTSPGCHSRLRQTGRPRLLGPGLRAPLRSAGQILAVRSSAVSQRTHPQANPATVPATTATRATTSVAPAVARVPPMIAQRRLPRRQRLTMLKKNPYRAPAAAPENGTSRTTYLTTRWQTGLPPERSDDNAIRHSHHRESRSSRYSNCG